jgi:hypothetical protein
MGNSTILDILGSIILGGYLLLMIFRLDGTVTETVFTNGSELTVQENLTTLVGLLEYDLRKIGYCADPLNMPDPSKSILSATEHGIKYLVDINRDGTVDTVEYYAGLASSLTSTPNPRDFIVYRTINHNQVMGYDMGITKFDFMYFDAQGDSIDFPITTPSEIYLIRLSVMVESSHAYDSTYSYAYWRQIRLAAQNLKSR